MSDLFVGIHVKRFFKPLTFKNQEKEMNKKTLHKFSCMLGYGTLTGVSIRWAVIRTLSMERTKSV
jgi:hypothetical protein